MTLSPDELPRLSYRVRLPLPDGRAIVQAPPSTTWAARTVAIPDEVEVWPPVRFNGGGTRPAWVIVTGARLLKSGGVGSSRASVWVDYMAEQPEWLAEILADASSRLGINLTAGP